MKIIIDIGSKQAYILNMQNDILTANQDAIADELDMRMTYALESHPTPPNVPDFENEPVEYFGEPDPEAEPEDGPDPEQIEFDRYEEAMLNRLDAMRNGDNDKYWPEF